MFPGGAGEKVAEKEGTTHVGVTVGEQEGQVTPAHQAESDPRLAGVVVTEAVFLLDLLL